MSSSPKCLPIVSPTISSSDCSVWEPLEDSPQLAATPPRTLRLAILDLVHTAVYISFTVFICALFLKTWIEVSGSGPRDIAKQLKDQQLVCRIVPFNMYLMDWLYFISGYGRPPRSVNVQGTEVFYPYGSCIWWCCSRTALCCSGSTSLIEIYHRIFIHNPLLYIRKILYIYFCRVPPLLDVSVSALIRKVLI